MLRPCQLNPKLLTYSSLEGIHDYNTHPIAPFGIEVTVHETANQQAVWGLSGIKGWYIGSTLEHYQCYKVYISSTKGEHIAMTVDFHPQLSKLPHINAAEAATHASKDLTVVLTGRDTNAPFAALGDEQLQAIWQLADIFKKLTHNKDDVQLLRVEKPPNQAVSQTENIPLPRVPTSTPVVKATSNTSSPRVQRNSGPHIIPLDDD
eukprot:1599088-Ditylum_brightwellii.AAC.1